MRNKKEARSTFHSQRATANHREEIVADFRPFAAYYLFLAFIVFYAGACFVRDMNLI